MKHICKLFVLASVLLAFQPTTSNAIETDWKAFGSAYYGQSLTRDLLPYGVSDNRAYFKPFSLVGANASVTFNENWSAAAQLVASGRPAPTSDYNMFTQWAYLTYTPWEGLAIRGGRQRFPIFTASEFINIGYQLPYRIIPANVFYISPFVSLDGISVTQTFDVGFGKLSVEVFGGSPVLSLAQSTTYSTSYLDLLGVRATLDGDGWRVRGAAARNTSSFSSTSTGALSAHDSIYSLGYRLDKYNIVSWGELVYRGASDGQTLKAGQYLARGIGGYALAGYRIGDFLPRYTFAQSILNLGIVNGQVTTHSIGLNYYASKNAVIKAEFEINIVPSVGGGFYAITQPSGATSTSGNSIFIGVDLFGGSDKLKS